MERDEVNRIVAVTTVLVEEWKIKIQDKYATFWCLILCTEIVLCVLYVLLNRGSVSDFIAMFTSLTRI